MALIVRRDRDRVKTCEVARVTGPDHMRHNHNCLVASRRDGMLGYSPGSGWWAWTEIYLVYGLYQHHAHLWKHYAVDIPRARQPIQLKTDDADSEVPERYLSVVGDH